MIATLIRFGIVTIATALAGLNGTEAHGDTRPTRHHKPAARPAYVFPSFRHRPPIVIPPGTIGLTYRRISRLIPEDEHPRTGMLEIHGVPAHQPVTITGMEGYRAANGIWYFRTLRPLIPCTSFIRTATIPTDRAKFNYRVFRLIPGRIVTLRW